MEKIILKYVKACLNAYIQLKDEEIRKDKQGRKKAKLTIVIRKDKRTVLTTLGQIEYERTYYKNGTDGSYVYVVDKLLEVEPRERISENASSALVNKAVIESYSKAAQKITNGAVSKQTIKEYLGLASSGPGMSNAG